DLPDVRGSGLVVGGARRGARAGATPVLELVVGPVVQLARVALPELEVRLDVVIAQVGGVELAALGDVPDVAAPDRGPAPQPVAEDRAAGIAAVLGDALDAVAVGQERRRLQAAVGAQVAAVAGPLVAGALGDLVDGDPRGGHGHVGARDRDLHLLEGAEVE